MNFSIDVYYYHFLLQRNALNDSHAQLMVHWLGEGTNVMICLARDPPLSPHEDPNTTPLPTPSTIFISYDYGDKFEDKSDMFMLNKTDKMINSTVDQFMTHPKFNTVSDFYSHVIVLI